MLKYKSGNKNKHYGDWPSGIVVKFVCSALVAWGLQVRILDVDLHIAHQAMLWWCPMYKMQEDWHTCWLSDNLP